MNSHHKTAEYIVTNELPFRRMETNREELSRIEDVLKKTPKGMNVIEIAQAIGM